MGNCVISGDNHGRVRAGGGGGHAIGRYIINERTIRRERSGDNENLSCLCTNQGGERSKSNHAE